MSTLQVPRTAVYNSSNQLVITDRFDRRSSLNLPAEHDIVIQEGSEFTFDWLWTLSTGTSVVLNLPGLTSPATGATVTFKISDSHGASAALLTLDNSTNKGVAQSDVTNRVNQIRATAAQTAALSFKKAVYDLTVQFDEGAQIEPVNGWILDVDEGAEGFHARITVSDPTDFDNVFVVDANTGDSSGRFIECSSSTDPNNDGTYQIAHITSAVDVRLIGVMAGVDSTDTNMQIRSTESRHTYKLMHGNVTLQRETTD